MKLIHTADLHIGKMVNEFSMLEDQRHILEQILKIALEEQADGIIIAGDIYDRSIPSADAVTTLDWFLSTLIDHHIKVFMISGNHDSAERIGFASSILDARGLYIAGEYDGTLKRVIMQKGQETLHLYLLPFIKPQTVKYYEELSNKEGSENIKTFEDGVRRVLENVKLEESACNLLVTHQFVTWNQVEPDRSDSEVELSLGGIDNVDISVFNSFDYVALGHIHRPQRIGRDTIRYAGSPLKYSFSEVTQKKSVTVLTITGKNQIEIQVRSLEPLHDMRKIKGSLRDLMSEEVYSLANRMDYIQATLTDTDELIDPMGMLRSVYPNTMQLLLEKNQKEIEQKEQQYEARKSKTELELFQEFYEQVTGREFDDKKRKIIVEIIEETKRE